MPPKFKIRYFVLALILIAALFLRLYKIEEIFPFDFDQQVPAEAAFDFFTYHKITLVGQELSFEGFFLGPLHNWIQFIPYGICQLSPDCVPYFYLIIGVITIAVLYFIAQKIFDTKTATITCLIYAVSFAQISFEGGVNSNYFLFLASTGLLFCFYKYFLGENKYIVFGAFIAGIAVVNFNPVFIFSALAFFLFALIRPKRSVLVFIAAALAFLASYLPLVVFNFRHDNILLNNFLNFIHQNITSEDYLFRSMFLFRDVLTPFFSFYLFQSSSLIFSLITLVLIGSGIYLVLKSKNRLFLFLPFWIIFTFVGFVFYKGWVPNYYFQQVLLPMILLVSISARKFFWIFLTFAVIFLFTNVSRAINYSSWVNYETKKKVVELIINDTNNQTYNLYNNLPISLNTGYPTLFKLSKKEPREGGKNLYILENNIPEYFLKLKYQKAFPDKQVEIKTSSFIEVVSVK